VDPNAPVSKGGKSGGSSLNKTALGLGLFFGFLILFLIAAYIFYIKKGKEMLQKRKRQDQYKDKNEVSQKDEDEPVKKENKAEAAAADLERSPKPTEVNKLDTQHQQHVTEEKKPEDGVDDI
jgi:hypothetical protein